jgi:pimeloyl-ACP methyl ester carboxylesterase
MEGSGPDTVVAVHGGPGAGMNAILPDMAPLTASHTGEPIRTRGSECDMPVEALRYYFRSTARLGPEACGNWDFTAGLERVSAPLLVIYGDRDAGALAMQAAWAAAVPEGRLLVVPEAGKEAHADRPDLVFRAVREFFAGGWPAGAVTNLE